MQVGQDLTIFPSAVSDGHLFNIQILFAHCQAHNVQLVLDSANVFLTAYIDTKVKWV